MKSFTKKSLSLLALSFTGAVACGAFVGCGSDDSTDNPGTDAGKDATATDASHTDAAPGTDSGPGSDSGPSDAGSDAGDSGPSISYTGTVSFSQTTSGTFIIKSAGAGFSASTAPAVPSYCTVTHPSTACTYTVCDLPAPSDAGASDAGNTADASDASDAAPAAGPNAGDILITGFAGTAPPSGGVTLHYGTNDVYTVTSPMGLNSDFTSQFVKGGETLTYASATGNTNFVGAFTGTVVQPADINVTAPAFSTGIGAKTANFPLGSDLNVAYSAGTASTNVLVNIGSSNATARTTKSVSCTFPAAGGTGVVPSAGGLANLDPAGTGITTFIQLTPMNSTVVKASNGTDPATAADAYTITLQATGTGAAGSYTND